MNNNSRDYTGLKVDTLKRMVSNRTGGHCKVEGLTEAELIAELEVFDRAYITTYGILPSFNYGGTA